MSLTILVHKKVPTVGIVRWFLDPKVSISYASGPLVQMSLEEFRTMGWDWISSHLAEYAKIRLSEKQATAVFKQSEEKNILKERCAIRIRVESSGDLTLIPQMFKKYTLAGLESFSNEQRRTVPKNSTSKVFWKAFDDVLTIASEDK
jgi:hypothetical protein